jgi:SAM-dependent methyltransferase
MTVHPKLTGRTCYHKYEIEAGLWTPGQFFELEPQRCLDELQVPRDLTGLRALDIGAWDGPVTFELERRGAQVTALDIQDPDVTVFNAVKEIKRSAATYVRGSVYDALPDNLGTYDIVVFAGVYYHLKNPVLALQRIRPLLKDDGWLFIEGASMTDYFAAELTAALDLPQASLRRTAELIDRMPISFFDTEQKIYPDWSNWFFPTARCLEEMIRDSGFRDVELHFKANAFYNYSHRRLMGRARAESGKSKPEEQRYEHFVATTDLRRAVPPSRVSLVARLLPRGLQRTLRRARAALRGF